MWMIKSVASDKKVKRIIANGYVARIIGETIAAFGFPVNLSRVSPHRDPTTMKIFVIDPDDHKRWWVKDETDLTIKGYSALVEVIEDDQNPSGCGEENLRNVDKQ